MLNKEKHQLLMGRILQDIYRDTTISPLLGLKGGTCARFFYGLPRFSVDLDFDLLAADEGTQEMVHGKILSILQAYGEVKNGRIKRFTLFSLLSYGRDDRNIKVEINTRAPLPNLKEYYEMKEYLGIAMLVAKKDYLFGSKLAALTSRSMTVMRDIYDVWFFAKNNWDIDTAIIKIRTGKSIKDHLADCIKAIEEVKDNEILQGLGELLSERGKIWVKGNLRKEAVLLLKNYQSVLQ